jgi:hypothetical protein
METGIEVIVRQMTQRDGIDHQPEATQRVLELGDFLLEMIRTALDRIGEYRQDKLVLAAEALVEGPARKAGAFEHRTNGQPLQSGLAE